MIETKSSFSTLISTEEAVLKYIELDKNNSLISVDASYHIELLPLFKPIHDRLVYCTYKGKIDEMKKKKIAKLGLVVFLCSFIIKLFLEIRVFLEQTVILFVCTLCLTA